MSSSHWADSSGAPDWVQSFGQWWGNSITHTPPQIQDILKRVLDMGKVYMGLAEQVYGSAQSNPEQPNIEAWMRSLESGFTEWLSQRGQGQGIPPLGFNASLFEGWQQIVDNVQGMEAFRHVGLGGMRLPNAGLWQEHLQKALATPSFGFTREAQERLKTIARLALEYQQTLDTYTEAFAKQGTHSIKLLRERIQQLADQGDKVDSLRELYDLWVDVSEEEYARFALSDEYQVVYGDLVNAFLALKRAVSDHVDSEAKAAGLPVKADLNAAFKSLYLLRRENHALRRQLSGLEQRLAELERKVASDAAFDAVKEASL